MSAADLSDDVDQLLALVQAGPTDLTEVESDHQGHPGHGEGAGGCAQGGVWEVPSPADGVVMAVAAAALTFLSRLRIDVLKPGSWWVRWLRPHRGPDSCQNLEKKKNNKKKKKNAPPPPPQKKIKKKKPEGTS